MKSYGHLMKTIGKPYEIIGKPYDTIEKSIEIKGRPYDTIRTFHGFILKPDETIGILMKSSGNRMIPTCFFLKL